MTSPNNSGTSDGRESLIGGLLASIDEIPADFESSADESAEPEPPLGRPSFAAPGRVALVAAKTSSPVAPGNGASLAEDLLLAVGLGAGQRPQAPLNDVRTNATLSAGHVIVAASVPHLVSGTVVVGRRPEGDQVLVVDDQRRTLSRSHCRLTSGPDGLTVEDLGSVNGTLIERSGKKHSLEPGKRYLLVPGDAVMSGSDVELFVVDR